MGRIKKRKLNNSIMKVNRFSRIAVLLGISAGSIASAFAQNITGPSSSQDPYLVRTEPGVVTVSILTVGDAVNYKADGVTPYRMVGIPDGLGAFDNGDGTFTLLMNHELASTTNGPSGIVRDHGFAGAKAGCRRRPQITPGETRRAVRFECGGCPAS